MANDDAPRSLQDRIRDIIATIESTANHSDEHTIRLAEQLRELRDLVVPTLDGTSWYAWASDNIRLQRTRLRELIRIAEADDPRAEAAYLRQLNARRQLKYQKSVTRYLPRENRTLISWARKASREEAAAVLRNLRDKALRTSGIDDPVLN